MNVRFQVLSQLDIPDILSFAESRLAAHIPDPETRMFAAWNARWRKEALEHYAPMGWSFKVEVEDRLVGFFLGQPFLFWRGQTQSLWIEHIEAETPAIAEALADVAIRIAREKHLQRALLSLGSEDTYGLRAALAKWNPQAWADDVLEIRTTKG